MRSLRRSRDAERPGRRGSDDDGREPGEGTPALEVPVQRIGDAPDRVPVCLEGNLRMITLRPRGGVPALEAELADGTGSLTVVWLGRRHITGVHAGRSLRVQGRIGQHGGVRTMYNPRYELLP